MWRLEAAPDNLRAALSFATEQREAEPGLRLSAALGAFWQIRGPFSGGYRWLERMLAAPGGRSSPAQAKALGAARYLARLLGE